MTRLMGGGVFVRAFGVDAGVGCAAVTPGLDAEDEGEGEEGPFVVRLMGTVVVHRKADVRGIQRPFSTAPAAQGDPEQLQARVRLGDEVRILLFETERGLRSRARNGPFP